MSDGGIGAQISDQVKGEVGKIASDVGDALKKLPGDVVKAAVEEVGMGSSNKGQGISNRDEQVGSGNVDPQKLAEERQKKQVHAQRLKQVQRELEEFRQKKKAHKQQEKQIEEQQKMEEIKKKESENQKRQKWLINKIQQMFGGTGEGGDKMVG